MLSQPFFIPSIILLVLTFPLILGLIPRNRFYGVRTVETMADEKVWFRVNAFAGWAILVSNLIYITVAFFVPDVLSSKGNLSIWLLHLCAFIVPLGISVLLIRWYAKSS